MNNEYAGLYKYVKATQHNKDLLDYYRLASAGPYPNIRGMRENRGWNKGFVIRCGNFAYLVPKRIFDMF